MGTAPATAVAADTFATDGERSAIRIDLVGRVPHRFDPSIVKIAIMSPAANRMATSLRPPTLRTNARVPRAAKEYDLIAVRERPQRACKTTAITTGLIPYRIPET